MGYLDNEKQKMGGETVKILNRNIGVLGGGERGKEC